MCQAQAEEGAGVRKARCAGGAADSAGMLVRPHPRGPPPSGCLDLPASSAGALSPAPTLRLPMGAAGQLLDSLWPLPKCPLRPNLVVASWLCKKRLGDGDPRPGVPGRGQVWEADGDRARSVGSGRERTSELGVVAHPLAFPVALPTLVLTGQELVPSFLEFRCSEIAVNRTRVANGPTRASTAGFHSSILHLGKLSSHTLLPSPRRKGDTGDSLRPWEAPSSGSYRHFTPPKPQKTRPERASQESGGRMKRLGDLVTSGRGPRSRECVTSVSLPRMGPLPGGPLSRRHAPAATLPGAGRHNRVSWAGITLPSPARPGPGGGPGASEPVRLGPGRGAAGGHGGAALLALDTSRPEDPAPLCQAWTLTPAHLRALLHPAAWLSRVKRSA